MYGSFLGKVYFQLKNNLPGREVEGRFKREGTYVYLWLIYVDDGMLISWIVVVAPMYVYTYVYKYQYLSIYVYHI